MSDFYQQATFLLCDLLTIFGIPVHKMDEQEIIQAGTEYKNRLRYNDIVSNASILKWGERAQANQTTEECAELIVALNKFYNRDYNGTNLEGVVTEVADVEIMCSCMRNVLGNDLIETEKNRKLERLATSRLDMVSFHDMFNTEAQCQAS